MKESNENIAAPEEGVMTFWMGEIELKGHINKLKEWADELEFCLGVGNEYSKRISDCKFAIEVAYQKYYDLNEDDWSTVHNETELERHIRLHGTLPED